MKKTTLLALMVGIMILASTSSLALNITLYYNETTGQYETPGEYISSSLVAGSSDIYYCQIEWDESTPPGTDIVMKLRSNETGPPTGSFLGPNGTTGTAYQTNGSWINTIHNHDRYMQWKSILSTTDPNETPALYSVTIDYTTDGDLGTDECACAARPYMDTCDDGDTGCWDENYSNGSGPCCGDDGIYESFYTENIGGCIGFGLGAIYDTTPPTGTIIINNGDSFAGDTKVLLSLTYDDNVGVMDCAYSNDNVEWTSWENCIENKSWNLIAEDGRRYVYYKVRDLVHLTYVANDSIFLDRSAASIFINDDASHTNSSDVNLTINFENIVGDPVYCSFRNDSMGWTDWGACPTTPNPLHPVMSWTLEDILGLRTVSMRVNTSFGFVKESNDTIIYDSQTPNGTIEIWAINVPGIQEANNHTTAYTTVSLKLQYDDNDAVAECRFANDGESFTPWEDCTSLKTWILRNEDGNRTVYYQIKDYAENIFEANDTIALDKTGAGQDTTPPSAPVVIDDGVWTNNNTMLHAVWSGAYDPESEILNIPLLYSYSIGTSTTGINATNVLDWSSPSEDTFMLESGLSLSEGVKYYINVKVINSGNLENQSSSDGITVDTVPCQITSLSSSTHDPGNWTNNSQSNNPQFSWAGNGGASGVYGYSYVLDFNSATIPDTIPEGDYEDLPGETSIRYDNIIDGKLNFHVRCRDNAGNWGDEGDYAVWIDASPPSTPQMTEHEIITDQTNMTFNWTESIEPHSYNVTYEFELYNHSVFNSTYLVNRTNRTLEHITIFNLTSGVTYYPQARAWNRAELNSSWSSEVSTIIDYLGPDIIIITPGNGCNVSSLSPVIRAETNEWAICSFRDLGTPTAGFIDFDYTESEYHESRANVNETNLYTFNITCMDAIGNSADVNRIFTADPDIAISFSSISLASQYYIGFTASIPLELDNKLGGVSYSDFAVSIDNENLSSDEFGITDLGCGDYLLEIKAPSAEGEYDIEIYAGSDYENGILNMKHLNFSVTYLGTLTDDDKKDQIAYAASGNATVGIATDSLAGDITTSNETLNLVLDPMGGSSYIFAVPSPSSLRAVDRLLEEKEFSEVINPNFGSEIEKVQYKTTLKLDYAYADIYSLMSESEEYGFEQFMPGKYSMLVKNTGTDPDTGNQKIEIVVS